MTFPEWQRQQNYHSSPEQEQRMAWRREEADANWLKKVAKMEAEEPLRRAIIAMEKETAAENLKRVSWRLAQVEGELAHTKKVLGDSMSIVDNQSRVIKGLEDRLSRTLGARIRRFFKRLFAVPA